MSKKTLIEELFVLPPGVEKTFSHDDELPSLPVPTLRHTIDLYVDSIRPFVTTKELENTKVIAREFEEGIGKELHNKLLQKAATSRNWVEQWWEDFAYLSNRQPLIPHCSMSGIGLADKYHYSYGDEFHIKFLSTYMHHLMKFWYLLHKEKMKPTRGADGTYFSMVQFRRLFNTVRIPGDPQDTLVSHFKTESEGPCPDHIVVLCRGRLFILKPLDESGFPISPIDWEVKLNSILTACQHHIGSGVGILTCDERQIWAKNREHLIGLSFENRNIMHTIDTAICFVGLDLNQPFNDSDIALKTLAGDFANRWADKSIGITGFKNGAVGGLCDHTAFDGMISITSMYYVYLALKEKENAFPTSPSKSLSLPTELNFHLDQQLRTEIQQANVKLAANKELIVVTIERFTDYGKQMIQAHRLHPDAYVQMALQLAYYRLHHKAPATYETATTRVYYNGRTETVRACTVESMEWVEAMLHPKTSATKKIVLFKKALSKHEGLMNVGRENAGCDRHLFGLYCIAAEEGLEIPKLYSDTSYTKSGGGGNFVLSTSLVGYTPIGGGLAPMCLDGYGCFYNICPKFLQFSISAWRDSHESSSSKFFACIAKSLEDMMALLGPAPENHAKL